MQEVNNGQRYLYSLLGIVAFCSSSFIPIGIGIPEDWSIYLPYLGVALTIVIIIIIKPAYFFFGIRNNQILIKTNPVDEDYIVINKDEFAGYELNSKMGGLKHDLIIFKKHPKGILKSEALNVFFLSKVQIQKIENLLTQFKIHPAKAGQNYKLITHNS